VTLTPLYAATVRATGIVLDPYEAVNEYEELGGTAIVELPAFAPGIVYHGTVLPAALPPNVRREFVSERLPRRYSMRRPAELQ
jgi:hypothetical protein